MNLHLDFGTLLLNHRSKKKKGFENKKIINNYLFIKNIKFMNKFDIMKSSILTQRFRISLRFMMVGDCWDSHTGIALGNVKKIHRVLMLISIN